VSAAHALTFSIDAGPAGTSFPAGTSNNAELGPGPIGGPPIVVTAAAALGILAAPPDELDAFTYSVKPGGPLYFSVDRPTVGVAGVAPDVFSESAISQVSADIYLAPAPGLAAGPNALSRNQHVLGLLPAILPGVPLVAPDDNIDALDMFPTAPILFSLATGNAGGFSGADVLAVGVGPVPVISSGFAALGLVAGDDIDALHRDPVSGTLFFSLIPGSPSLGGVANPACPAPGACSAADVFTVVPGAGPFGLFATAASLGLVPATDNVTAIAFVPEPSSSLLLALGLTGLAALRRRSDLRRA
jgi:hypothetical protein